MNRISFCTVCMDRLFYLRETLPASIEDNQGYPNLEFVVLDYNSKDGLGNWIRSQMGQYLESRLLKYYRTEEPVSFSQSHSKNMVANLASGDVVCLLDADVYAGADYAQWVDTAFSRHGNGTIVTTIRSTYIPFRDVGGKLAFHKDCFRAVRGYDETFTGYGFDDVDLAYRLEQNGGKRVFIEDSNHLKYISHSHIQRVCNDHLSNQLDTMYVLESPGNDTSLGVLYLLKQHIFMQVTFTFDEAQKHNQYVTCGGWKIEKEGWLEGTFEGKDNGLQLDRKGETTHYQVMASDGLVGATDAGEAIWVKVAPYSDTYMNLILLTSECQNRFLFHENVNRRTIVNPDGWGKGTVKLNFH